MASSCVLDAREPELNMHWTDLARGVVRAMIVGLEEFDRWLSKSSEKKEPEEKREKELVPTCMDAAGVPTRFIRKCSKCGETGRNARTHKEEMRDGTYHWVEVEKTEHDNREIVEGGIRCFGQVVLRHSTKVVPCRIRRDGEFQLETPKATALPAFSI